MRRWRPSQKCLYVLPEVHGNNDSFQFIANRIFPFRIFEGSEDMAVFLGDYIDGDDGSALVIDSLINIKNEYHDRVVMLKGNHEQMLLNAIDGTERDFEHWISQGGSTTILSYLNKAGMDKTSPFAIKQNRLRDIIPNEHIEFIRVLKHHHIQDDFVFFHGSFDPNKSIADNSTSNFLFDTTASRYVKECVRDGKDPEFVDSYIHVGAHNFNDNMPFIHQRYFMLGGSAPESLIIAELNSMQISRIKRGKSHIYPIKVPFHE